MRMQFARKVAILCGLSKRRIRCLIANERWPQRMRLVLNLSSAEIALQMHFAAVDKLVIERLDC